MVSQLLLLLYFAFLYISLRNVRMVAVETVNAGLLMHAPAFGIGWLMTALKVSIVTAFITFVYVCLFI